VARSARPCRLRGARLGVNKVTDTLGPVDVIRRRQVDAIEVRDEPTTIVWGGARGRDCEPLMVSCSFTLPIRKLDRIMPHSARAYSVCCEGVHLACYLSLRTAHDLAIDLL
jgi:hypothetical protein